MPATAKAVRQRDRDAVKLVLGLTAITIALLTLWTNPSHAAGKGTRVKPGVRL